MTIRVSGKNLDIGDALRGQVEARIAAALDKYVDGTGGSGHVVVSREGAGFRTECVISLGSGTHLEASGVAADAHASFDQSALRIEKRLRRYKRRLKDRLGDARGIAAAAQRGMESAYTILEAPDEDGEEDDPEGFNPIVVAETTRHLPSMGVSDAVAELDLTGAPVVVFRHAGNGRLNVVYRRRDGAIGWVDPPVDGA